MIPLIYQVSVVFTCSVCAIALLFILANIYLAVRRRFSVTVNCWFCNAQTKVPYDSKNSFSCQECLQYNGFDNDGGYNKVIPEQHKKSLNESRFNINKTEWTTLSNGLCALCNHNQNLKVRQLASFVPLVEKNYDVEVEHFREQLEKAYQLCPECNRTLQRTLMYQDATIFGYRVRHLQKKSLSLLNLNNTKNVYWVFKFFKVCITLLAITILMDIIFTANYSDANLREHLPRPVFIVIKRIKVVIAHIIYKARGIGVHHEMFSEINEVFHKTSDEIVNWTSETAEKLSSNLKMAKNLPQIPGTESINEVFVLIQSTSNQLTNIGLASLTGVLLQTMLTIWEADSKKFKVLQLVAWMALCGTEFLSIRNETVVKLLQIAFTTLIICSMLLKKKTIAKASKTKPKRKKIRPLIPDDYSDISDTETFQNATLNSPSSKTPKTSTSSNCDNAPQQKYSKNTANSTMSSTNNLEIPTHYLNDKVNRELNASLSNLYLGHEDPNTSPTSRSNTSGSSKTILSPSKLKTVTQNPWIAGGFWHSAVKYDSSYPDSAGQCSRTSSQSSGFVSQANNYVSLPGSRATSCQSEFDRNSILSEPVCDSQPKQAASYSFRQQNVYYPVLSDNESLYIHAQGQFIRNRKSVECKMSNYYWERVNCSTNRKLADVPLMNEQIESKLQGNGHLQKNKFWYKEDFKNDGSWTEKANRSSVESPYASDRNVSKLGAIKF